MHYLLTTNIIILTLLSAMFIYMRRKNENGTRGEIALIALLLASGLTQTILSYVNIGISGCADIKSIGDKTEYIGINIGILFSQSFIVMLMVGVLFQVVAIYVWSIVRWKNNGDMSLHRLVLIVFIAFCLMFAGNNKDNLFVSIAGFGALGGYCRAAMEPLLLKDDKRSYAHILRDGDLWSILITNMIVNMVFGAVAAGCIVAAIVMFRQEVGILPPYDDINAESHKLQLAGVSMLSGLFFTHIYYFGVCWIQNRIGATKGRDTGVLEDKI